MVEPKRELTDEVVAQFRDKISKDPEIVKYFRENDYLTAYAMNTDSRVDENPKGAIGREDEFDSHGLLQLQFLKELGMKPHHTLLDFGCGVGRAARRFVPYLDAGNYTGIDISPKALAHAKWLSHEEGWADQDPRFFRNSDISIDDEFDFIWGHSIFTHSEPAQIALMVSNASQRFKYAFAFTYKESQRLNRSGLKQWQQPWEYYEYLAQANGLKFINHPKRWPAGQRTIVLKKA